MWSWGSWLNVGGKRKLYASLKGGFLFEEVQFFLVSASMPESPWSCPPLQEWKERASSSESLQGACWSFLHLFSCCYMLHMLASSSWLLPAVLLVCFSLCICSAWCEVWSCFLSEDFSNPNPFLFGYLFGGLPIS